MLYIMNVLDYMEKRVLFHVRRRDYGLCKVCAGYGYTVFGNVYMFLYANDNCENKSDVQQHNCWRDIIGDDDKPTRLIYICTRYDEPSIVGIERVKPNNIYHLPYLTPLIYDILTSIRVNVTIYISACNHIPPNEYVNMRYGCITVVRYDETCVCCQATIPIHHLELYNNIPRFTSIDVRHRSIDHLYALHLFLVPLSLTWTRGCMFVNYNAYRISRPPI